MAFDVLLRVDEQDAYAAVLLDHHRPELPDPRDAGLAHELVLGVLRCRSLLDQVLGSLSHRSLEDLDPAVRTALRIGAYEILFLDRVPPFASVHGAVELTRARGGRSATGFVNGVLRGVAREGSRKLPAPAAPGDVEALALFHSHPPWWVRRLVDRCGWDRADKLLEADNRPAATVIRANVRRVSRDELASLLAAEGVVTEPCRFVPEALRVRAGVFQRTEAFRRGLGWIQDEASQLVPLLFTPDPRQRVLDACAAPGTKTLQLLERLPAGGLLVACDRHRSRLRRARELFERCGAGNLPVLVADMSAGRPPLSGPFDGVLVDAPCTGTGTLRRHPEIRWRLRPEDPGRLGELQLAILDTVAPLVAPGGFLVYAACSVEPEEGEHVRDAFLVRHPEFRAADPRPHLPEPARHLIDEGRSLRTSPEVDGLDGFFAAVLAKRERGPAPGTL